MSNPQEEKLLKKFGRQIAEIRKKRGMTQQELAELLDVSLVSIGYIETGKRWPRILTLNRIADVLRVQVKDFF